MSQPRVVMVVGASSGIGLVTARLLAERGDHVVLVARDAARLAAVAADLPGEQHHAVADVADADAVQAAVDLCVRAHGRLDGVVTTAQAMAYGAVEALPPEVLERMVTVGVAGTANVARAALPAMRRSGGGHLVVVGSLLAEISVPRMSAYCAAKWGQAALVRALQIETSPEKDVHVSLVVPGAIDTPVYRQAGSYAGAAGNAPPPVVQPERVARACLAALERPRRTVHVGPGALLARTGYRLLPGLYDRLSRPLVDRVLLRGPDVPDGPGNVFDPRPEGEGERGGWTVTGRLRDRRTGRARWRR